MYGGYEPDGYDCDPLDADSIKHERHRRRDSSRLGENSTLDEFAASED